MSAKMKDRMDPAVSPVIGVLLMLVVTIIVAAVVSGFAGGLAGDTTSIGIYCVKSETSPDGMGEQKSKMTFEMLVNSIPTKTLKSSPFTNIGHIYRLHIPPRAKV